MVRTDVAAVSFLVETFLHGSVQEALAGVQSVYVGVGVVFQLRRRSFTMKFQQTNLTMKATFPGPQAMSRILASFSTPWVRNSSTRVSGYLPGPSHDLSREKILCYKPVAHDSLAFVEILQILKITTWITLHFVSSQPGGSQ